MHVIYWKRYKPDSQSVLPCLEDARFLHSFCLFPEQLQLLENNNEPIKNYNIISNAILKLELS